MIELHKVTTIGLRYTEREIFRSMGVNAWCCMALIILLIGCGDKGAYSRQFSARSAEGRQCIVNTINAHTVAIIFDFPVFDYSWTGPPGRSVFRYGQKKPVISVNFEEGNIRVGDSLPKPFTYEILRLDADGSVASIAASGNLSPEELIKLADKLVRQSSSE